jgi:hypothetical protein
MWKTDYPVGHPELVVIDGPVDWRKPEDICDPETGNRIMGVNIELFDKILMYLDCKMLCCSAKTSRRRHSCTPKPC